MHQDWIPSDDATYWIGTNTLGGCYAAIIDESGGSIAFNECDFCDSTCAPDPVNGPDLTAVPYYGPTDTSTDPTTTTPFVSPPCKGARSHHRTQTHNHTHTHTAY
jgi:hypothetical protein